MIWDRKWKSLERARLAVILVIPVLSRLKPSWLLSFVAYLAVWVRYICGLVRHGRLERACLPFGCATFSIVLGSFLLFSASQVAVSVMRTASA